MTPELRRPESPGVGKLPVNGGWVAHKAVQFEAAMESLGTGRAPVAARPVLRISMLLPPGAEVARYDGPGDPHPVTPPPTH